MKPVLRTITVGLRLKYQKDYYHIDIMFDSDGERLGAKIENVSGKKFVVFKRQAEAKKMIEAAHAEIVKIYPMLRRG